jgi:hypothetical protein
MHPTTRFEPGRRALLIASLGCVLALAQTAAARESDDTIAGTNPLGGGGSVVLEPVPPRPKSRRTRVIYTCTAQSVVEFSDRPCAPGSAARSIDFTTGAGAAPSTKPKAAPASTRPKTVPAVAEVADAAHDAREAQQQKCESLAAQLDKVDSRMRQGYAAREAADLWNRWRDLKQELHSARCGRG